MLPFAGKRRPRPRDDGAHLGGGVGLFLVRFTALRVLTEQAPVAAEDRRT